MYTRAINDIFPYSSLPPSQGGKYAGFGYSRDPPPRSQSQEVFDTTLSSLASVGNLSIFIQLANSFLSIFHRGGVCYHLVQRKLPALQKRMR